MTTLTTPRTRTQCDRIADWLIAGRPITDMDALRHFGCRRLASRIHDLKKRGMDIETRMVKTEGGAHVAEYRLATFQHELAV